MRSRLAALGASGVQARTFHSAALAQLRHFDPAAVGRILPSKALTLRRLANSLPAPYKFRPAGDLATEIEWARNRRITSDRYRASLDGHEPPIPADLMERVYRQYEEVKLAQGLTDFEDLLELTIRLYDSSPEAGSTFRERYLAFTVDEYQDVNLLQQTLLERWLGERDELCAVGDDNQAIYGFTGASPSYLLALPGRFPGTAVVRLEQNYRSTPQVLALANRLAPALRTELPPGPEPDRAAGRVGRGRGRPRRRADPRRGLPARGGRDPLPHERPARRLRAGAPRSGHPVPGRGVPRSRGCPLPVAAARRGRRAGGRAGARAGARRRVGRSRRPRAWASASRFARTT